MRVLFEGKEYKKHGSVVDENGDGLGRLCFDIFKHYLELNPNKIYYELQEILNVPIIHRQLSGLNSKRKVIFNKIDFYNWYNNPTIQDTKRDERYFGYGNYGSPILYNDEELYFTTQWGNSDGNINNMIRFAQEQNYDIQIIQEESNNKMDIKNIILYGAPGVGKTHNYKNLISLIEEGKTQKEIFDTIAENRHVKLDNDTFEVIKKEKRVEFVTFHQSYSYEDFIEGFRPNENGNIELENGIFKNISEEAIRNSKKSIAIDKLVFSDALDILLKDKVENGEIIRINLKRDNSFFEIYDYDKRTIYYTRQGKNKDEKYHTLSVSTLSKMYDEEENNIIRGGLSTYYNPLLEYLLKIGKENKVEKIERKNFYIVIDEINRGNISKIFGELITLIEEDKRDGYEVTLPYSKDHFKVPSNLYIIATMNSTDKSIATIDIALRRRFTFLKMKPNKDLVPIIARKLFNDLNDFISHKDKGNLGEDYQLGHSYFMKVQNSEDLDFVKEYKIKPLLEEYFYADDGNLDKVIKILEEYKEVSNE